MSSQNSMEREKEGANRTAPRRIRKRNEQKADAFGHF